MELVEMIKEDNRRQKTVVEMLLSAQLCSKDDNVEVCENGDVFIHGNCAYPIILKSYIEPASYK